MPMIDDDVVVTNATVRVSQMRRCCCVFNLLCGLVGWSQNAYFVSAPDQMQSSRSCRRFSCLCDKGMRRYVDDDDTTVSQTRSAKLQMQCNRSLWLKRGRWGAWN